jgi:hypothetical protein
MDWMDRMQSGWERLDGKEYNGPMEIFIFTLAGFGIAVLIMSVGAIFQGKCLRGSCGGEEIWDSDGELLNCETCPVRKRGECESNPS